MKISKKSRYGLRAMIDLALKDQQGSMSINMIADRLNVSTGYLEQAFTLLKKGKLVTSIRGAQGGYKLALPAEDITIGDILRVMIGDLSIIGETDKNKRLDDTMGKCIEKNIWDEINNFINNFLDSITLKEMAEKVDKAKTTQDMYYI